MYIPSNRSLYSKYVWYFTFDYNITNGVINVDRNKLLKLFKLVTQKTKCDSFFLNLKNYTNLV